MLELFADPQVWASLLTLTALEIVLGIDNIIFISIMAAKLPVHQQQKARQLGLALALLMRLALLASISWVATLTEPLITVLGMGFSGRDLILLGGGLFLLAKGTIEIHNTVEGHEEDSAAPKLASFGAVVLGYMLGTFLAGRLTPRLGGARMIRIGTLLSLGGGLVGGVLALAGVLHLLAIVVPVFLFILGAGLTLPNATANAVGPYPTMAGLASSLLGFAQMAIAAVIGIVVGHLNDGTALPMMGAIALVGLGALLAHRLLVIPAARGGRSA